MTTTDLTATDMQQITAEARSAFAERRRSAGGRHPSCTDTLCGIRKPHTHL